MKQITELNESIELLKQELEYQDKKKAEDPEYMNEENRNRIKSILSSLENYNFHHYTVRNEIETLYPKTHNCSIKDTIFLGTILSIVKANKTNQKNNFLNYEDISEVGKEEEKAEEQNIKNEDMNNFDVEKKLFNIIERITHKTLHGENEEKICEIYNELDEIEFKENDKNIGYNDIDKLITNLKNKQPNIEFIAIKAIIISIINLTQEIINTYYKNPENANLNTNLNQINNNRKNESENELIDIEPSIYENIYNEYIFINNKCSILEQYFTQSFNNFRDKYKMNFTLSDLFTDIFWNKVFHNKDLSLKFIDLYIGKGNCDEKIRTILNKILNILGDIQIPLRAQVMNSLSLNQIENGEIDLITSLIVQKNINQDLIHKECLLNSLNEKAPIKKHKAKEIKKENIKAKNEDSSKENGMENKTVDEIYNYINENNEDKNKKKKKKNKKKNKKNEIIIKSINQENKNKINQEREDYIVNEFKKDIIQNMIDASQINKIKPVVSENFLKIISEKY